MKKISKYLSIIQSLISEDPEIRSNQIILDSSELIALSGELRSWIHSGAVNFGDLRTEEQMDKVLSCSDLSPESKDLFRRWAHQADKRNAVDGQRRRDKEYFERKTRGIRNVSLRNLQDLGLSRSIAEQVYSHHLLLNIAAELDMDLWEIRNKFSRLAKLDMGFRSSFYPYDGWTVPWIESGWSVGGNIYGPMQLPWNEVFSKAPFVLNDVPASLYLVEIDLPKIGIDIPMQWKVGITKREVIGRKSNSRFYGETSEAVSVVRVLDFSDARDAFFLEQKLIAIARSDEISARAFEDEEINAMTPSKRSKILSERKTKFNNRVKQLRSKELKRLGLGPSEWVWEGRTAEYVESSFDRITSYAPYFGETISCN